MTSMPRVAVVGSGIAGLAAARALAPHAAVTLFEADARFGGHAHTVDVTLGGVTHGVDTGFLVFNERTYPQLIGLFDALGVETAPSQMSFSVRVPAARGARAVEWSGTDLGSVFAQRGNAVRPAFWRMLADLLRFNRLATALAERGDDAALDTPLGEFQDHHGFSTAFRVWYFLPMLGCIWSCPTDQMLAFPVATMIRFCHNHGLLQVSGRPRWFTVVGGAQRYVEKMIAGLADARRATAVRAVRRLPGEAGVAVSTDHGTECYDDVVLACHSDQALALLSDPRPVERELLSAVRWQCNRAVLHTDASVLPARRRAWAAWNYERAAEGSRERAGVCLHYLIDRLQPLPFDRPVIVSLNPLASLDAAQVIGEYDYAHPVFDRAAIAAQTRLPELQGAARTWYCGAWTRYGFHEDGLASGLAIAAALRACWRQRGDPGLRAAA